MIHRIKVDTLAELMQSEDGSERLIAEYIRLKQWYESIKKFNNRVEAGRRLERPVMTPDTKLPHDLSRELEIDIGRLLHTIEVAAVIEDIDLEDAIDYYIEKALKAERAYHGCEQSCCDGERCEKGCCDSSEGSADVCGDTKNTDGLQSASEALPDGVMSLEATISMLEAGVRCEMNGADSPCAGSDCPMWIKEKPGNEYCVWGELESYTNPLYHLKKYAETK